METQLSQHEAVDNWYWTTSKSVPKSIDLVEAYPTSYGRDGIKKKIVAFEPGSPSTQKTDYQSDDNDSGKCRVCNRDGHKWRECPTAVKFFGKNSPNQKNRDKDKRDKGGKEDSTKRNGDSNKKQKGNPKGEGNKKVNTFSTNQIEFHHVEMYTAEGAGEVMASPPSNKHWIADSGTQAFITPTPENLTNLKPSDKVFMGIAGQCGTVEHTGSLHNLDNVAVSSQAKRALCSTLPLAKESNMVSVVCDSGTVILKPGSKIGIKRDDVLVTAKEIDGLHRLTNAQMLTVAKAVPKK